MDFRAGATTSLGVLVFVATIGAHDVHAQIRGVSVDAAYRQTWTDNTPLGHPAGVALTLRRAGTGIAVWIEAERLSAITHRHGSTCVGLIFPDEPCDPEPLEG